MNYMKHGDKNNLFELQKGSEGKNFKIVTWNAYLKEILRHN